MVKVLSLRILIGILILSLSHVVYAKKDTSTQIFLITEEAPISAFINGATWDSIGARSLVYQKETIKQNGKKSLRTCFVTTGGNKLIFREGRFGYMNTKSTVDSEDATLLREAVKVIRKNIKSGNDDESLVDNFKGIAVELTELDKSANSDTLNAYLDLKAKLYELCE